MKRLQFFLFKRCLTGTIVVLGLSQQAWAAGTIIELNETPAKKPKASAKAELRESQPSSSKWSNEKTQYSFFAMGYYRGLNTTNTDVNQSAPVDRLETAGLMLVGKVSHKFHPTLTTNLKLVTILENGSSRALVNSNREPVSGLFVDNLDLTWRPVEPLGLSVGALNQGYLEAPLLAKDVPYPGVQEIIYFGSDSTLAQGQFIAQQAVPASRSLGALNEKDEPFARFFTQTLKGKLKVARSSSIKARVTHFEWNNLTSYAASQGRLMGNSTTSDPEPATQFLYQYRGWETGAEVNLRLVRSFEVGGGGSYLVNTAAPEGQNAGRLLFGQMQGLVTREVLVNLRGESFINQADSSPAAYNAGQLPLDYGHNNREGYMAQVSTKFVKHDFSIRTMFLESRVIDSNPFQQNDQILFMSVEAAYDVL